MKCVLIPFGNGAEFLKQVEVDSNHLIPSVILGRNMETGLTANCPNVQYLSRSHALISYKNGKFFLSAIARQEKILFLNNAPTDRGDIELKHGDQISLLGSLKFFNYEISFSYDSPQAKKPRLSHPNSQDNILSSSNSYSPSNAALQFNTQQNNNHPLSINENEKLSLVNPETIQDFTSAQINGDYKVETNTGEESNDKYSTQSPILRSVLRDLLRQYECSICFEVMACAFSLSPCGDCFCFECIESCYQAKNNNCPLCQCEFDLKNAIPNKLLDGSIRQVLKHSPEELKVWEDRVSSGLNKRKEYMNNLASSISSSSSSSSSEPKKDNSDSDIYIIPNPQSLHPRSSTSVPAIINAANTSNTFFAPRAANRNIRASPVSNHMSIVDLTESQPLEPANHGLISTKEQHERGFRDLLNKRFNVYLFDTGNTSSYPYTTCSICDVEISDTTCIGLEFLNQTRNLQNELKYRCNYFHLGCMRNFNSFCLSRALPKRITKSNTEILSRNMPKIHEFNTSFV